MKKALLLLLISALLLNFTSCRTGKKKQQKYITNVFQELKDSFPNAEIILVQDSIKMIFPDNIMFETGSAELKETFFDRLHRLSSVINKYQKTNLLVTGHTDNVGELEMNDNLSKQRAENVKTKMSLYNVAKERLFVWGMGSRQPREKNDTEQGRAKNRRVEFIVLYRQSD